MRRTLPVWRRINGNAVDVALQAVKEEAVQAGACPDELLVGAAGDRFSYCRGKFMLTVRAGQCVVACPDLMERDVFDDVIALYAGRYPGADRRAVISMWSMYYFSTLMISGAVSGLVLGMNIPAAIDRLKLVSDGETGAPAGFLLPGGGWHLETAGDPELAMEAVLREHAAPLVGAIARNGGVSERLLWNNASAYLSWIVGEIAAFKGGGACGSCLMDNECWSDGRRNPLFGTIKLCERDGNCFSCRKVCCLRYALPGVCGCGDLCPLPQGRA